MSKCDKCGKDIGDVVHAVRNEYPTMGFPHDTTMFLCEKCKVKFEKYITKCYENFFKKEAEDRRFTQNNARMRLIDGRQVYI